MVASKAHKYWAIASLGERWTLRVLVLPGLPLVRQGPYRYVNHPNYIAVVGELVGMALMMSAWITGPLMTLAFGVALLMRLKVETAALRDQRTR
jgi:methyltransferase